MGRHLYATVSQICPIRSIFLSASLKGGRRNLFSVACSICLTRSALILRSCSICRSVTIVASPPTAKRLHMTCASRCGSWASIESMNIWDFSAHGVVIFLRHLSATKDMNRSSVSARSLGSGNRLFAQRPTTERYSCQSNSTPQFFSLSTSLRSAMYPRCSDKYDGTKRLAINRSNT